MKGDVFRKAYKEIPPRLPGAFLAILVYCVPAYALAWYFLLIDDLFVRILLSVLAAIPPVLEFLSGPRCWRSRGDMLWSTLFIVPILVFATGHKFNVTVLTLNAAMAAIASPYCWLLWKVIDGSLLLLAVFMVAVVLTMIYWVAALGAFGEPLELLLLPLLAVVLSGFLWAPVARWTLYLARKWKCRTLGGPGMQALSMVVLFLPVTLVASIAPTMLELKPIWSAVSLTIVGVLLSALVSDPLRRFLVVWARL